MTVQATVHPTLERPVSHWTGWAQWLALATMTLDHLVRYVFPAAWELGWAGSSLGRIAFPLFAAMVAWHGLFNTRNPLRYARRILVIGLAAQLPYMLMPRASDAFLLNVCFTLALGLAGGAWWRTSLARYRNGSLGSLQLGATAVGTLMLWYLLGPWVEYGHLGLLLIPTLMLGMHHLHGSGESLPERLRAAAYALPVLIVAGMMNSSDMAKSFTVATCFAVLWLAAGAHRLTPLVPTAMPRQLWLAWYPGHFALIALWLWLSGGLG